VRILYLSPYAPERCGIGDYTASFTRTVRESGHDVGVVTASEPEGAPREVIAALPSRRRDVPATVARIRDWDPDVVHLQFAVASYGTRMPVLLALLRALRPLRCEVVVTLHEVTRDTGSLRSVGRLIYRRLTELADRSIVHTDTAMAELKGPVGASRADATLIPHPRAELGAATAGPVELRERFGLGERPVLLAFGFIHVDKGLDDLVSALQLVRRSHDVQLVVAGDVRRRQGAWRVFELRDVIHLRKVRRLIARFGLEDDVTFTGWVPSGEVRTWFELAEAAVLPYTRIEQSGVANLAAAAGTPILASRVGGLVQEGSDLRWSFEASDPAGMAAVIGDFLSSPSARSDAARRAVAPELREVVRATLAFYAQRLPREPAELVGAGR
jgi:glycosyltransferase involved in cell wall biosynthesis